MNRKIILVIYVFACSIVASAVVLSTFSSSSHLTTGQETMIYKMIVLVIAFSLFFVADNALVKDTRSAINQFQKKNATGILTEGTFKIGRCLNISGIAIAFACLVNQILSIKVISLTCSVVGMATGVILYTVGIVMILWISPLVFEEDPI